MFPTIIDNMLSHNGEKDFPPHLMSREEKTAKAKEINDSYVIAGTDSDKAEDKKKVINKITIEAKSGTTYTSYSSETAEFIYGELITWGLENLDQEAELNDIEGNFTIMMPATELVGANIKVEGV